MDGYTETIRKYAADNNHVGQLDNPDGTGEVGLTGGEAGRRLAVRFTLNVAAHQIKEIRFQVFGCGFTVASCAAAAELAQGQTLEHIQSMTASVIEHRLGGLPAERRYCAVLAIQALQAAAAGTRGDSNRTQSDFSVSRQDDHQGRVSPGDELYKALMATAAPADITGDDRRLFACLLTVASHEPYSIAAGLGIDEDTCKSIIKTCFPGFDDSLLGDKDPDDLVSAPDVSQDILAVLMAHVPEEGQASRLQLAHWLARIIAARVSQPGHLWLAMGLFERSQLTASIQRHLPTLALANNRGMRWKKYLFKQMCDAHGGLLCKSPTCTDCSEYELCFPSQRD
ncbi:nitrogen fixation protein NifQ [uncultured Desulfuromusa sp.]|uniref:nitrogen fixation protein NifQ n=1 Tax=uncultured Desulfuromusa sp. TaxID=219183 RepID=UPI002AA8B00C|nr:nitrogen fixation protein NifQ [uncultured Desulfuromusa sp.]